MAHQAAAGASSKMDVSHRRQYVEMMHHRAMYQVNECLAVCLRSPRSEDKWARVKRENNLELYAKKSNTTKSVCYLGMNEIHCGFDEVYELLNFQNTSQFRVMMKLLYGRNFRDGALMANHAPREYDDDYDVADVQHSAVWFTLQDGRESVIGKDNMLAFFQALMVLHPDRSFTKTAGTSTSTAAAAAQAATFARPSENILKRTLALAWLPFSQAENLADVQESVRLQYTLLIEEVSWNRLRVSCVATSFRDGDDIQPHSSSASRHIARRLVNRSISRLESAVIAARISASTIVSPHQWVRNEDRASCVICWKSFHSIIRRRHHCRLCGEVVCGSCCSLRSTNVMRHNKELDKVRVCHMCSNRGGGGGGGGHHNGRGQQLLPCRSNSFVSPSVTQQQVGGSTMGSLFETSRSRGQLYGARGNQDEDDGDESQDAYRYTQYGPDDGGSANANANGTGVGSGYFGYIGAIMGAVASTTSTKLISLRSMSRADLLARSNSTTSSWKQSDSSTASSIYRAKQQPLRSKSLQPSPPPPPPSFVGRATTVATPRRTLPPPPLPLPRSTTAAANNSSYDSVVPAAAALPASLRKQADFLSLSFLHPAAANPERVHLPPKSIIADIGSYERGSITANAAASHERPSLSGAGGTNSKNTMDSHQQISNPSQSSLDPLRRTSILSIAMLESCNSSEIGSNGAPKLDAARENHRLKLMRVVCSPACTLVDRVLMKECCDLARFTFGVQGAFLARVEETYVVIEHVVGTTKMSAIDHYLRADTPCDYVLVTPPGEPLFQMTDSLQDQRTSQMVMVKDLNMEFFVGVSICVRGLPIACLCAFSEAANEREEANNNELVAAATRRSSTQFELHVLQGAAQRIERELEHLLHGLEIL